MSARVLQVCLVLCCVISLSCNVSKSAVLPSPVFHFGESPCTDVNNQKAINLSKVVRPVVKRSFPKEIPSGNWSISMHIAINRIGEVVFVEYLPESSSLKDQKAIMSCIEAVRKTIFENAPNGPEYECGRWTINFSNLD